MNYNVARCKHNIPFTGCFECLDASKYQLAKLEERNKMMRELLLKLSEDDSTICAGTGCQLLSQACLAALGE